VDLPAHAVGTEVPEVLVRTDHRPPSVPSVRRSPVASRSWLTCGPMPTPKPFRGSDLRKQVRITGFDLTPDGRHAVYARQTIGRERYRSRLGRVPTAGGRPEQLTNAPAADGRPRISPEGTRLVFLSDRSDTTQAWILPLDGGEPRMVEGFPDGVTAAEWSPAADRLAVIAPSGERRFSLRVPRGPTAPPDTTPDLAPRRGGGRRPASPLRG